MTRLLQQLPVLLAVSLRGNGCAHSRPAAPHAWAGLSQKEGDHQSERIRDRLWIWGHPAGVYNDSYLAPLGKKSTIEPVAAAQWMGIR